MKLICMSLTRIAVLIKTTLLSECNVASANITEALICITVNHASNVIFMDLLRIKAIPNNECRWRKVPHFRTPTVKKGGAIMPIKYDKTLKLLEEKGFTSYRIRKEKILGQATLTAIKNGTGGLDHRSIARLCKALNCQPGDIMEYVEDET